MTGMERARRYYITRQEKKEAKFFFDYLMMIESGATLASATAPDVDIFSLESAEGMVPISNQLFIII